MNNGVITPSFDILPLKKHLNSENVRGGYFYDLKLTVMFILPF